MTAGKREEDAAARLRQVQSRWAAAGLKPVDLTKPEPPIVAKPKPKKKVEALPPNTPAPRAPQPAHTVPLALRRQWVALSERGMIDQAIADLSEYPIETVRGVLASAGRKPFTRTKKQV